MSAAPLILDAFACAGLYADGLTAAGWQVVCLDNDPKALAHNPHETIRGDAMTLLADHGFVRQFDALHASPPCQGYSATRELAKAQGRGPGRGVNLVPQTLALLRASGLPWTVENVERSPLKHEPQSITLCGSTFGLAIQRHRIFAYGGGLDLRSAGGPCDHATFDLDPISGKPRPWGIYYTTGDNIPSGGRTALDVYHGRALMGLAANRSLPWRYLCEGLPPAYGVEIGSAMLDQIDTDRRPGHVAGQLSMFGGPR